MSCLSYDTIINNGGLINENIDDSVFLLIILVVLFHINKKLLRTIKNWVYV
jgi:hypothetical protein